MHPALAFCLRYRGERTLSYLGSAFAEQPTIDAFARDCMAGSEAVILGAHGPLTKAEFSVERWSDTLQQVIVRQESAGEYLLSNEATLAAFADAALVGVSKKEEGVTVSFTLPPLLQETAMYEKARERAE